MWLVKIPPAPFLCARMTLPMFFLLWLLCVWAGVWGGGGRMERGEKGVLDVSHGAREDKVREMDEE